MKQKIKPWFYTFMLSLISSSVWADATSAVDALTDDSKPIVLSANQKEITINLKSNPTTGYSWFLMDYDKQFFTATQHTYLRPNPKLMGAPGVEKFTLQVNPALYAAPHAGTIKLVYKRPWESANPAPEVINWVSSAKQA